jgi:hypothetical protein
LVILFCLKEDSAQMEHPQARTRSLGRNHRYTAPRTYPELVKTPTAAEREATYQAALKLVARIDEDLTRGIRHYRNKAGVLLTTLDEVVRAILDNDLLVPEEQGIEVIWTPAQELAA